MVECLPLPFVAHPLTFHRLSSFLQGVAAIGNQRVEHELELVVGCTELT